LTAFRTSTELFERKQRLEAELNQIFYSYRAKVQKVQSEYDVAEAIRKNRWLKDKADYDASRLKKLFPSHWNRSPTGTQITQMVSNAYGENSTAGIISKCVADIVDAVVIKATSHVKDEPFPDFQVEPRPDFNGYVIDQSTGETLGQQQLRIQGNLQKDIQALTIKLNAAEQKRESTWKKLVKAKSEYESPQFQNANYGMPGSVPSLRSTGAQSVPSTYTSSRVPSYVPNRGDAIRTAERYAPSGGIAATDSKYSAAKVRERVGADGSVKPVTTPKQDPDGLYQRPSGRTRKGMDWDPVRGVWVPQND
jgi:hypothetical protein